MEIFLFILLFFACVYFLPSLIAAYRNTHHLFALFLLNLFLGWTFFGWVLTLFIALLCESREDYEARRLFFIKQLGTLPHTNARSSRTFLLALAIILTILLVVGLSEKAPHLMAALHHYAEQAPSNAEF